MPTNVLLYQKVVPQWYPKFFPKSTRLKLSNAVSTVFLTAFFLHPLTGVYTPVIEMKIFKYRIWNFSKNWLQNPYTKPKNSLRAALRGCKLQNLPTKYTLLKKSSIQIRSSFDWDYASFTRCIAFKIWKYQETWGHHDVPAMILQRNWLEEWTFLAVFSPKNWGKFFP